MKKWVALGVFLIFLVAGAVAFYLLSQPPKESLSDDFKQKAITKMLGRKAQLTQIEEKKGKVAYNGKYISFDYPAKAVIYNYKDPGFASSSSLLEDFSFDIKSPRLIFNLAVLKTSGKLHTIDDDSGVMFRKNSPGQYKDVSRPINGYVGRIYERDDENPEKTAFFLVGGRFYSISVTGNSFDDIQALADNILKTVKFK